MNIPVEILAHILGHADNRTIAALRKTCRAFNRMINDDLSLQWHGDWLRHKIAFTEGTWGALALLSQYEGVVRAAPANTPYFMVNFTWLGSADLDRLSDHFKWLDARLRHICISIEYDDENTIGPDGVLCGLQCVESIEVDDPELESLGDFPCLKTLRINIGGLSRLPLGLVRLYFDEDADSSGLTPEVVCSLQVLDNRAPYDSDIDLGRFLERCPAPRLQDLSISVERIDMRRTNLEFPSCLTRLSIRVKGITEGARGGENFCFAKMPNLRVLRLVGNGLQGLGQTVWPPNLRDLHLGGQMKELGDVRFPETLERLFVRETRMPRNSRIGPVPPGCAIVRDFTVWSDEPRLFYVD